MDLLFERHKQQITNHLTEIKIDKEISVGKIYRTAEGFVSGTIVAFIIILGERILHFASVIYI